MSPNQPTLHLVCGKIAAGKSTLTAELGHRSATVVVAEDDWLSRLYPGEQSSLADYVRNSSRLRSVMGPHVVALLRAGVSVVLDFPANTPASRAWMRSLFEAAGVPHQLHHLDVPDEVCKARLRARNAEGRHAFTVTDEEFDLFTSYFVAPTPDEGFDVIVHRPWCRSQ
ncbi:MULTISPECIES: ATP-binding protein [unclassified Bradyrhizobium]|uniref:AAA family ATPase n=1 Tax=unclassified Bradyrhizobium TaxID=2631580 RepID=UPI0028EA8D1B|nr:MULTISPECIES: ATP-binding protein [unclassified Bradyrhizobium]